MTRKHKSSVELLAELITGYGFNAACTVCKYYSTVQVRHHEGAGFREESEGVCRCMSWDECQRLGHGMPANELIKSNTDGILARLQTMAGKGEWDALFGVLFATHAAILPIDGMAIARRIDELKREMCADILAES